MIKSLLVLLLALTGITAEQQAQEPKPINVVTWNLEWFPGQRPNATKEQSAIHTVQVQEAPDQIQPDILLLQEVRDWESVEGAIVGLPDLQVNVVSAFREGNKTGSQQVAIISNLPVNSCWSEIRALISDCSRSS